MEIKGTAAFDYQEAFSRNVGWLTDGEQEVLRGKRVAIAGMGGVGGSHLLTLARLGIGRFRVADLDRFELANLNRQAGASVSTLGAPKTQTMASMARGVNPDVEIETFDDGVDADNVDRFLAGVDLYVDGLDFFVPAVRSLVFARCADKGIPAITAAPIGMGAAYLVFMPGQMSFEEYFGLSGQDEDEQLRRFLLGLSPRGLHRSYLVDPSRLDLQGRKGPSTSVACQLCAGVAGAEAAKILLGRGKVFAAPYYHLFDAYRGEWVRGRLTLGHRNPLQRVRRALARRLSPPHEKTARPVDPTPGDSVLEQILDLARWAPSGDNSQPWRFELVGNDRVLVRLRDESDHDVYDRYGDFSLVSGGCLLENTRIAASRFGRRAEWRYEKTGAHRHLLTIDFPRDARVEEDGLRPFVTVRSVDRRPYRMTPLSLEQRRQLEACLGDELEIRWFESPMERLRITRLNALATDVRLRIPETFETHQRIVDFEHEFSRDGVPVTAIGLSKPMQRAMGWALRDRSRNDLLNRIAGTGGAQLQMDFLPGLRCAGHFILGFRNPPSGTDRATALLRAGEAVQRFWLRTTALGLALQPGMAPVIFGSYAARGVRFTGDEVRARQAQAVAEGFERLWPGRDPNEIVFAGRLGTPLSPLTSRSVRKPLEDLIVARRPASASTELWHLEALERPRVALAP